MTQVWDAPRLPADEAAPPLPQDAADEPPPLPQDSTWGPADAQAPPQPGWQPGALPQQHWDAAQQPADGPQQHPQAAWPPDQLQQQQAAWPPGAQQQELDPGATRQQPGGEWPPPGEPALRQDAAGAAQPQPPGWPPGPQQQGFPGPQQQQQQGPGAEWLPPGQPQQQAGWHGGPGVGAWQGAGPEEPQGAPWQAQGAGHPGMHPAGDAGQGGRAAGQPPQGLPQGQGQHGLDQQGAGQPYGQYPAPDQAQGGQAFAHGGGYSLSGQPWGGPAGHYGPQGGYGDPSYGAYGYPGHAGYQQGYGYGALPSGEPGLFGINKSLPRCMLYSCRYGSICILVGLHDTCVRLADEITGFWLSLWGTH